MKGLETAERVTVYPEDNFVFQRSLLAYHYASNLVSGSVLEIGTGTGYGTEIVSPHCTRFLTVDKHFPESLPHLPNVEYIQMRVPPLDLPASMFDYVISFQVIEHIKDDAGLVSEVARVLKPGGKFIVSTPNSASSLTRNPWHVREYTSDSLNRILGTSFAEVETFGIVGNEKVYDYYSRNRASVRKYTRFDLLRLQYRLPSVLLRIPYDILNRINRKRLLKNNSELTTSITMDDYSVLPIVEAETVVYDLLSVATKRK